MGLWIGVGIVAIFLMWGVMAYNGLVRLKNWVKEAWAQIDVQLQRRNDLIPNLVETVKGYTKHESETLSEVIRMRNQLTNAQAAASPQETMELSNQLTGALKTVFALSEAYPDLKANENFLNLQEELTNTENKIAYSRQLYNSSVAQYNIKVQTFPTLLIARMAGFTNEVLLETPAQAKEVPTVKF